MIRHIVMFRLQDKADAEAAVAQLRSMDGKIESLRSIEAGINVVDAERNYDVAIHTTFDDRAGLDEYAVHPEHQPVIQWMRAHTTGSVAIDYEF